ncbi:MAG TPA: transcription-repair coupling factor, partial [Acidimicrobiia bacterium]|nr:transcription-repair coupling factor [Acidimicrobiia bacterium]
MPVPLGPLVDRWGTDARPETPGRLVIPPALRAFFLAGMAAAAEGPVLAVVPGEREAEDLVDDVSLFSGAVFHLPAWETLPFEHVSPAVTTMAARAQARHALGLAEPGTIVVASVRAATQRLSPSSPEPVRAGRGQEYPLDDLVRDLVASGYHRTDRVETRGEIAVRGGIVDVFPAQAHEPVRLDFWGDEIDEIRVFSVGTQRSIDPVDAMVAFPARELVPDAEVRERAAELLTSEAWAASTWDRLVDGISFAGMESWLPWLAPPVSALDTVPESAAVVLFDPARAGDRSRDLVKEEAELAAALAPTWGAGAPEAGEHPALYLPLVEPSGRTLEAPPQAARPGEEALTIAALDAAPGDPESVAVGIRRLLDAGVRVVVAMDGEPAARRVASVLAESGVVLDLVEDAARPGSIVIPAGIHHGFVSRGLGVAVLGEQEIAGRRRAHRRAAPRRAQAGSGYGDLEPGDFVVHHRHGIGRFEGLVSRTLAGVERDYLLVAYAGQDKLYVPTDQLAAVRKYTGGEAPRLSRMGGADWDKTRSRVRKEVAAVAEEVVALHRSRAKVSGHAYAVDTPWQREMEAAFPFEETPDQLTAIIDVKRDMERDEPMDRLVFGDVGFGKTEVAVRATFKAVQDGRQAAVLVPTTLLAQQHHQTFSERFAPYPMRVEALSRFLTVKQQREVVRGLEDGSVDVVIGTHRLLSEDVRFKDLGVLVVDEEQRFGVQAKDRIKALRTNVDVLTLTATPIPRTLEMALTGIRPVSRIATPPEDRHPILTFVGPYERRTVSAAIRREMLREGQVFYVHNRIQSIDRAVAQLREIVPEARYAVAHGRMSEGQLEQIMLDFWNGEYDVLVATTIIESGLDLPSVNTLIVERADLLGLAQLYQLRGRVGRSTQRAYAYLFHPPDQTLTEDAYRRLEAIGEFGDLGSGFQLAMRDLEIRGAGSILGNVQSGHIAAVGFDLYIELVAEAVAQLESGEAPEDKPAEVRIELPVDAHLPDDYVADSAARLEAYRRLAAASTEGAVDDVVTEWEDRYGPLPEKAQSLIDIARLRVEAMRVGITEVVRLRNEVKLAPVSLAPSQEVRLQRLTRRRAVIEPARRTIFVPAPDGPVALTEFLRTMF